MKNVKKATAEAKEAACEVCGRVEGQKCLNYGDTDCALYALDHPKTKTGHTPEEWAARAGRLEGLLAQERAAHLTTTEILIAANSREENLTAINKDLLDVAREIVAQLENIVGDDSAPAYLDILRDARAAIAKAKGE